MLKPPASSTRRRRLLKDGGYELYALAGTRLHGPLHDLDKTLDAITERYGIHAPFADLAYSSPAEALLADSTSGGWVARESVEGQETHHLAFKDHGVNWQVWIPTSGDPVPLKASVEFTDSKRLQKVETTFKDWNFAPQLASDRFTPTVPADYEGIAMVQRARVMRNQPKTEDGNAATSGAGKP